MIAPETISAPQNYVIEYSDNQTGRAIVSLLDVSVQSVIIIIIIIIIAVVIALAVLVCISVA
jgi:hypothetical protein